LVRVYLGSDLTMFLDFNDGTFKAGSHTTTDLILAELGFGFYSRAGGIDLSGVTIPAGDDHLLFVYDISIGASGSDTDTVQLVDEYLTIAADVDATLTASHGAGAWTSGGGGGGSQVDVRQTWTPGLGLLAWTGIISLESGGESVTLPGGATLAYQGYDRGGAAIPGCSGAGTLRTIGSDTFFDATFTLTSAVSGGETIEIRSTVSGSGIGLGVHRGLSGIAFPMFG
jgi:hypothetical protein